MRLHTRHGKPVRPTRLTGTRRTHALAVVATFGGTALYSKSDDDNVRDLGGIVALLAVLYMVLSAR